MKKFHVRQGPFNLAGLFFSLIGFILVLLCLIGCLEPSGRGLYFAKVTNAVAPTNGTGIALYYGWQGYCLQDTELNCYNDRSIMVVPFDVSISTQLNGSYPYLFADPVTQDVALNPEATPTPAHDPKIFPAAVLCLLSSATLVVFCFMRVCTPHRYQDEYYTRGFLAAGSAVLSLLLVVLSSTMYQNAITELNLEYPNLIATQGPAMTMIGVCFASFFLASYVLLRGCMSMDAGGSGTEGYNPI